MASCGFDVVPEHGLDVDGLAVVRSLVFTETSRWGRRPVHRAGVTGWVGAKVHGCPIHVFLVSDKLKMMRRGRFADALRLSTHKGSAYASRVAQKPNFRSPMRPDLK